MLPARRLRRPQSAGDSAVPQAERKKRAPHLPAQVRRGRGGVGSPCGAPGAGPGRREDGRGAAPAAESPHPPSARRFLILGNFLNAPGQAPHFLPAAAPAPRAPPQPPVPPAPKAPREPRAGQRRPERAGTRRRGRPGRPEGRAAGDRSTRLPGTEARGQGPSYTMRGTANNGNLSPCRLF